MDREMIEYLQEKRAQVLDAVKPIMQAFGIKNYDYVVKETGQTEALKIGNVYIGCSSNSISAIIDEIIKYLVVARGIYLGHFDAQSKKHLREYWLSKDKVANEFSE